ncbi:MAG: hypothetical protein HRT61_16715 [Ekhidna sp.]|nr:hypothetical protein [Ekhidna sp.]
MKARLNTIVWLGAITVLILFSSFDTPGEATKQNQMKISVADNTLKKQALKILETKCNVCHRKQNPLMVFKEKNMSKRAKKIYKMVFKERKMPKGNDIRLTNEEYITLEKWLFTQEIF